MLWPLKGIYFVQPSIASHQFTESIIHVYSLYFFNSDSAVFLMYSKWLPIQLRTNLLFNKIHQERLGVRQIFILAGRWNTFECSWLLLLLLRIILFLTAFTLYIWIIGVFCGSFIQFHKFFSLLQFTYIIQLPAVVSVVMECCGVFLFSCPLHSVRGERGSRRERKSKYCNKASSHALLFGLVDPWVRRMASEAWEREWTSSNEKDDNFLYWFGMFTFQSTLCTFSLVFCHTIWSYKQQKCSFKKTMNLNTLLKNMARRNMHFKAEI